MVDREAEIAAFMAANTFECARLVARITSKQCVRNFSQRLPACKGCPDKAKSLLRLKVSPSKQVSDDGKPAKSRWTRLPGWFEIPGYPGYMVSDFGVRTRTGYKLTPHGQSKRYTLTGPDKRQKTFTKQELLGLVGLEP
jgi:hypothetical protein